MGKLNRHSGQTREPPKNGIDSIKQHKFADQKTVDTRKPLKKNSEKSENRKE